MKRKQLILAIAKWFNTSQVNASEMLDTFVSIIEEWLLSWQSIIFRNFGSFNLSKRSAKRWINPQTKEYINVPWYTTIRFKASNLLKDKIKYKFDK